MPRVVHFEISVDEIDRAIQFYREVFGWQVVKWDGPIDYWLIRTGENEPGIDGAFMQRSEDVPPTVNTIDVDNCQEFVDKVVANGGKLVGEIQNIPGVGVFAYCTDTEGNLFGVMESEQPA